MAAAIAEILQTVFILFLLLFNPDFVQEHVRTNVKDHLQKIVSHLLLAETAGRRRNVSFEKQQIPCLSGC